MRAENEIAAHAAKEGDEEEAVGPAASDRRKRLLRVVLVALMFVGAYAFVWAFDLGHYFELEAIQQAMGQAGIYGLVVFVVAFSVGELLHIPGMVFVIAAMLVYDRALGAAAAYLGALTSVSVSFVVVRAVGGRALGELKHPFIVRILARLDDHPIRTVTILRVLLFVLPPLNYALALTRLTFAQHLIGSAVGLIPPVIWTALFLDQVLRFFS